ncbi:hypothetical protein [Cellulosimicrobium sp. Marseille-Q4280]|uniref:hypothetical protein n=1 Tax=Cellulosimicrobium sp. Marseille-Q4280 TaxID=2937992 RepID=UPI00203BF079|nr:hypothetical protein [Cellulosimicrobium sp. Marseille-Q4280]
MTSTAEHRPTPTPDTKRMRAALAGTPLEGSTGLAGAHVERTHFGHPRIVVTLAWEGRSLAIEIGYRWLGSRELRMFRGDAEIRYALWDAVIEAVADGTGLNPLMIADDDVVRGELTTLLRALD